MAKVDVEIVEAALKLEDLDSQKRSQIMNRIKSESEAIKSDKGKEPTVKKQFVIVVNDPYGKIVSTGMDFSGWVVQIPEDAAPMEALEKLHKGVYDFNLTPKGRRMPIKTIAEACEFGSAKLYKEHKIWVKTKEPVLVLRTNGKIPHDVVDA